jgi:hypothetical protein
MTGTKKPKTMKPQNTDLMIFDAVNTKIITLRDTNVILDSDVAVLYGVKTKEINQAIARNPRKFPNNEYIFELSKPEWHNLRALHLLSECNSATSEHVVTNCDHMLRTDGLSDNFKYEPLKSHALPKAFTEKGLYMLATILKSDRAIDATLAIIEAFAKLKQLSDNIALINSSDTEIIEPEVLESTGSMLGDLLFSHFPTNSAETSLEFNIGIIKGKRTIKGGNSVSQTELDDLKKMIINLQKQNEQILKKMKTEK